MQPKRGNQFKINNSENNLCQIVKSRHLHVAESDDYIIGSKRQQASRK